MNLEYNVPLVRQQRVMSCWFAAAEMIKLYQTRKKWGLFAKIKSGIERAKQQQLNPSGGMRKDMLEQSPLLGQTGGTGLDRWQMVNWGFFKGLKIAEWDKTFAGLHSLLEDKGPLYCASLYPGGRPHAIVISGVFTQTNFRSSDRGVDPKGEYLFIVCPYTGYRTASFVDFEGMFALHQNHKGLLMSLP